MTSDYSSPNAPATGAISAGGDRSIYRPLMIAGLCLGIGQGGFFDGIVLHQLLQWHHMFSSVQSDMTVAGLELNTIGDGLFHLFDWLMTSLGVFLLWRAGTQPRVSWSGRVLLGSLLFGFGLFNVVEGLIDHQILGIHHVRSGPNQLLWDMGFLASGVLLMGLGAIGVRSGRALADAQSSSFLKLR